MAIIGGGIWYLKKRDEEAEKKKKTQEKKALKGAEELGVTIDENCTRLRGTKLQRLRDGFTLVADALQTEGEPVTPYTVVDQTIKRYSLPCPRNPDAWTAKTPTSTKIIWSMLYLEAGGVLFNLGLLTEAEAEIAADYLQDVLADVDFTEAEAQEAYQVA